MSVNEHRREAPTTVNCMIITVSDTRTIETDKSGKLMMELVEEAGYEVVGHQIVKDGYSLIKETIISASQNEEVEAILINGGTGIASRDVTFEVVSDLLEKQLPGFGELFRYLSYVEDIGSAAILSRAIAGVFQNKAIFSTPGSSGAVKLAMTKLIMPELGHVMREIYKDRSNNREEEKMDFSHFNEQGRAKMVDISEKVETKRSAIAHSEIMVSNIVLDKIESNEIGKGDVLGVAQVAGIMAAKNTAQLIPMCHPLPITGIDISFTTKRQGALAYIKIEALVKTTGKTGVEMEALTAATGTALTIYDMCKAVDKDMVIGPTYIVKKTGGKSDYEKLD